MVWFLNCGLFFFILKVWIHKELAAFYVKSCPVYIFLKNFVVSIITFRYLYYLEFILYMVLGIFLISFSFSCLKEPSLWLLQFTSQTSAEEGSLVCTPSLALTVFRVSGNGHSDQCDVMPCCSLDLHFSNV